MTFELSYGYMVSASACLGKFNCFCFVLFFPQRCDKPLVSRIMRLHLKSPPSEHILITSEISPILPLTQPIAAHLALLANGCSPFSTQFLSSLCSSVVPAG